jgi:hypothetical protein
MCEIESCNGYGVFGTFTMSSEEPECFLGYSDDGTPHYHPLDHPKYYAMSRTTSRGEAKQVYKESTNTSDTMAARSFTSQIVILQVADSVITMKSSAISFLLAGLAAANPTPVLDKRATTICGQWDSVATGAYTVYQDLWGMSSATSGSQCTTVTGISSNKLVWSTSCKYPVLYRGPYLLMIVRPNIVQGHGPAAPQT